MGIGGAKGGPFNLPEGVHEFQGLMHSGKFINENWGQVAVSNLRHSIGIFFGHGVLKSQNKPVINQKYASYLPIEHKNNKNNINGLSKLNFERSFIVIFVIVLSII